MECVGVGVGVWVCTRVCAADLAKWIKGRSTKSQNPPYMVLNPKQFIMGPEFLQKEKLSIRECNQSIHVPVKNSLITLNYILDLRERFYNFCFQYNNYNFASYLLVSDPFLCFHAILCFFSACFYSVNQIIILVSTLSNAFR